jgi:hypothetical protein
VERGRSDSSGLLSVFSVAIGRIFGKDNVNVIYRSGMFLQTLGSHVQWFHDVALSRHSRSLYLARANAGVDDAATRMGSIDEKNSRKHLVNIRNINE